MRKNLVVLILSVCLPMMISGCSENDKKDTQNKEVGSAEAKLEIEKNINAYKFYKNLSKGEKVEIARELFDDYINENRTDRAMVESQGLKREPVTTFTDYRINEIDIEKEEGLKFTVSVSYDIQYTNESNIWIAGNGELKENNWVINKFALVDIEQVKDKYIITSIGTG